MSVESYENGFRDGQQYELEAIREILNEAEDDIIFASRIEDLLHENGLL